MICKEDVETVANDLGFSPSEEDITKILVMYPEQEKDQQEFRGWQLIVEDLLYSLNIKRK
jgi:hypothetical protein